MSAPPDPGPAWPEWIEKLLPPACLAAPAALVFVRAWMTRTHDVVAIWHDKKIGHLYCAATGLDLDRPPPTLLSDREIERDRAEALIARAIELGLLRLASQTVPFTTLHFDDHFAIRTRDRRRSYVEVAAGVHEADPEGELPDLFLGAAPRLREFYRRHRGHLL